MASFIDVPATANRFNEGQATVRDFLEVTNTPNLSFAGSWTIEAWVATTDDDAQFNRIVRMPVGGLQTYSLLVRNGEIQLVAGGTVLTGIDIADGEFHLVSGVYDSAASELILYVDGVEVARNAIVGSPPTGAENLFIGTNGSATNQFFDGSIAEVRLWNTARSQGEIVETAIELNPASHADLTFFLGFDGSTPTDFKNAATITRTGQTHLETVLFARAGETGELDTQNVIGEEIAVNGDPGPDAVYTLSSPDGIFFLHPSHALTNVTGDGTGLLKFKGSVADVNIDIANVVFRPDDGFTGQTTVTFSIDAPGVAESVQFAMAVVPNNSLVTTALDVVDATDGLLSLREAVMLVNDGVTSDTITFDPTVFNGEPGDIIRLTQGQIEVTENVSIDGDLDGDGTPDVVISGDALGNDVTDINGVTDVTASLAGADLLADNSRLFHAAGFDNITLNGVTLTGGRTTGDGVNNTDFSNSGGAVFAGANLFITDSVIAGNSTAGYLATGGALYAYGGIDLTDSLVTGNQTSGANGHGGAAFARFGHLDVIGSSIGSNSAGFSYGGALGGFGTANIISSTVANNQAGLGGGIKVDGQVYLLNSTLSGNNATGYGGGIHSGGTVTIANSTVSGNTSNDNGGGVYTGNNAVVRNSTVSGNSTSANGGYGGGISAFGSLTLTDSIVLGNNTAYAGVGGDEIYSVGGYVFNGNNLVGANYAAFAASLFANVVNANPADVFAQTVANGAAAAGVLAYNGGEVLTIALRSDPSNPAIDAAGSTLPTDAFDLDGDANTAEPLPVDGRGDGFFRTLSLTNGSVDPAVSSSRDLGAFEAQGALGLVVTTAADNFDLLDGFVSLREAVAHANNGLFGDDVTITFDPTVFNGQPGDIIRLTQGELVITAENLTIDGDLNNDGTPDVVISGDASGDDILSNGLTDVTASRTANLLSDNSRIFNHSYFNGHLYLEGLTLTGGSTGDSYGGGAIRTAGALTVEDSLIAGNSSSDDNARGGGIRTQGALTITDSTVSGNVAGTNTGVTGNNSKGGGAYASGAVIVTGSTIADNRTLGFGGDGGGLATFFSATITGSTISGNSTVGGYADGGGLYVLGTLTLTDSTVSGNSTAGDTNAQGGGIFSSTTTIVGSTISNNSTTGTLAKGGGIYTTSTLTMLNSTVSGNSTTNVEAGGGGIFTYTTVNLTNVTVSGNSTDGANSDGGGVRAGNLNLFNSTVSGNSTAAADATGGGVFATNLDTTNSIILGNETSFAGTNNDEVHATSSSDFFGHNIIGADTAAFDASVSANVSNADPTAVFAATVANGGALAGVLADNGGTVETIALKADVANPAIDAGSGALPADSRDLDGDANTAEPLPVDARGVDFPRNVNANGGNLPDLGAFEAQPTAPSLVVNTALDVVDAFDNLTSLREAVGFVNSEILSGTITFDASVFNGEAADIIRLSSLGEIKITKSVAIDGDIDNDGAPDVVISGDTNNNDPRNAGGHTQLSSTVAFNTTLGDNTRIFNITDTNADTTLTGLVLTGGHTTVTSEGEGGAVRAIANLTIADSIVRGNSTSGLAEDGGALFTISGKTITITNSLIDNNATLGISGANGGAIFSFGDISIYDSTVSNNFVVGSGADGGALAANGNLIKIVGSTISGNAVLSTTGGGDGGAIWSKYASLTIANSTLSGNYITGPSGQGGAIYGRETMTLINTTLAGNKTFGSSGHGGAIYLDDSGTNSLKLYNSTITGNAVYGTGAVGGGLRVMDPTSIANSIILGNYARLGGTGSHEVSGIGSLTFNGQNIVGQMPYAFNAGVSANVSNGNPFLIFEDLGVNGFWLAGQLADNGGPVETVMLKGANSNPAIDGGVNGSLPPDFFDENNDGSVSDLLPFDARGELRIVNTSAAGSGVDLGAV